MKKSKIFLVIGGDMRQIYAAEKLSGEYEVYCLGFDKLSVGSDSVSFIVSTDELPDLADCILLPPVTANEKGNINAPFCGRDITFDEAAELIASGGTVFGGRFSETALTAFGARNAGTVNYLDNETFNIKNAVPTAEGALKIAIEETASTIYGSKAVVVGFGRIGKVMAKMLSDLGASVTVAARKPEQLEWAKLMGCDAVDMSAVGKHISGKVTVFNTVPAMCLDEKTLACADSRCLIIDLASRPGGVDKAFAAERGIRVIHALGLPGKYSPVTAGGIIAETVLGHLHSKGEEIV